MVKINEKLLPDKDTGVVLYNSASGTSANFILTDSIENYEYIEIFSNAGYGKLYIPIQKTYTLSNTINSDTVYNRGVGIAFNGVNVTLSNNKLWYGATVTPNANLIYRVVGYKSNS